MPFVKKPVSATLVGWLFGSSAPLKRTVCAYGVNVYAMFSEIGLFWYVAFLHWMARTLTSLSMSLRRGSKLLSTVA